MIRALVKDNLGWILGYSIGTSLYIFMIAAIYPSIAETGLIDAKLDSLPKELLDIFQYDPATMMDSVLNILSGNYYGLIFQVVALLFALTMASRLLALPIDSGELMLYLSAPISRRTYVMAAGSILVGASFLVIGLNGAFLLLADILWSLDLNYSLVSALLINSFSLLVALGAIALFFATLFNESGKSYMLGAAVFGLMVVGVIVSGLSSNLEWMKAISLFTLFDANGILKDQSNWVWHSSLLLGIAVVFFILSLFIFKRRNLTL